MKFSEYYKLQRSKTDDWFDPIMNLDTKLFIDPFLVYRTRKSNFLSSHKRVIDFFNESLKLVATLKKDGNRNTYLKVKDMLTFPEVKELCLGYTAKGITGSGTGSIFAEVMIKAIQTTLKKGIQEIRHFEELEILNEGIGPDRISDMTANILRKEFVDYTIQICKKHNIPLRDFRVGKFEYDTNLLRWIPKHVQLPQNPTKNLPVLLTPSSFLDTLPEINSRDFWNYASSYESERLRRDFNFDVARRVDKKTIVRIARAAPDILKRYIQRKEKYSKAHPYNISKDPDNFIKWYEPTGKFVENNPLTLPLPNNDSSFFTIVEKILNSFKDFVELKKGRDLLWNDDGSQRREGAVQRSFLGIALHYCRANNIDLSKEANIGRGPVDFKFSNGFTKKVLIEVKKTSTATRLFEKIKKQLPTYLRSEETRNGYYLLIRYSKKDDERLKEIREIIKELNKKGFNIKHIIVNAEKLPSASKIK